MRDLIIWPRWDEDENGDVWYPDDYRIDPPIIGEGEE